ncbi:hypothetical protein C8Q80DRAFT_1272622 [Daedaleopsis nitida]|nr:hypothetical protein C8Q80DRAFT_1272622 [Daedaleopsis nitida]
MDHDEVRAIGNGLLTAPEIYWRERYEWLKRSGYLLGPRYAPDWVPFWMGTDKWYAQCDDGIVPLSWTLSGSRMDNQWRSSISRYPRGSHPHESEIALYLSSPPLSNDPRNHCCPTLDVLEDPLDDDQRLIVMPLLRMYDEPKFTTVGEAVEFFRQAFEGLLFMHEHHVTHRDITKLNIMMDSKPILPEMFHPQLPWRTLRDTSKDVRAHTRTARPVKYYFTDYGLSKRYGPHETDPLELPILGGDRTVPEFKRSHRTRCNPYHTDVYCMGNLIRGDFLQMYKNFAFMEPLIGRMVQDEPGKRPTMVEVNAEFRDIVSKLSWWKLRERLVERRDTCFIDGLKACHHLFARAIPNVVCRRAPIPSPKDPSNVC